MSNEELVSFKNSADQDMRERHERLVALRERAMALEASLKAAGDFRFQSRASLEKTAKELDGVYQEFLAYCGYYKIARVLGREDLPGTSWSDQMFLDVIYRFCSRELVVVHVRFPKADKTRLKILETLSFGLPEPLQLG